MIQWGFGLLEKFYKNANQPDSGAKHRVAVYKNVNPLDSLAFDIFHQSN